MRREREEEDERVWFSQQSLDIQLTSVRANVLKDMSPFRELGRVSEMRTPFLSQCDLRNVEAELLLDDSPLLPSPPFPWLREREL